MESFITFPAKTTLFAGRQMRRHGQLCENRLRFSPVHKGGAFSGIAAARDKAHNARALP
jgi:hypothetical protein